MVAGCGGGATDSASGGSTRAAAPGVLSITSVPRLLPAPKTHAEVVAVYQEAADLAYGAGARGNQISFGWGKLEHASASYDSSRLSELSSALDFAKARALVQYVGIQPINTVARDVPSDLLGRAFDDPVLQARFRALLDQVVAPNRGRIQYLSIGNEVDVYLAVHPGEIAAYTAFFREAARYVRSLDPGVKVGVTIRGDAVLGAQADTLKGLNDAGSDAVMLTYYPLQTDGAGTVTVRDPSVVAGDFNRFLAFAGSKPLVFQEVGYPASATNFSSEAKQASFVHLLFAAWQAAGSRIPYLNLFALHDLTAPMCDELLVFYQRVGVASFNDYLCTLGLRRTDGAPKLGWLALVEETRRLPTP